MRRIPVNATDPGVEALRQAADVLRSGGIVAYPTDTFYGLAVDPRNEHAVSKLYRIKGRQVDKAIPLIAADIAQLEDVAGPLGALGARLARRFWPGPLSLLIPSWPGLSPSLLAGQTTVAVRVPASTLAAGLAAALGHPVTSTSANLSGRPPVADPDAVAEQVGAALDILLDGGHSPGGAPSTIVDATGDEPRLVREGAVPWERVRIGLESHR